MAGRSLSGGVPAGWESGAEGDVRETEERGCKAQAKRKCGRAHGQTSPAFQSGQRTSRDGIPGKSIAALFCQARGGREEYGTTEASYPKQHTVPGMYCSGNAECRAPDSSKAGGEARKAAAVTQAR